MSNLFYEINYKNEIKIGHEFENGLYSYEIRKFLGQGTFGRSYLVDDKFSNTKYIVLIFND